MTNNYSKFAKFSEIVYYIIAGICLIESVSKFISGQNRVGVMFLIGVAFGVTMGFARRRMRIKMTNKNEPK
ncbi:MAG: hypothetical protein ACPG6V_07025 [Flavobacteriales bacterium]